MNKGTHGRQSSRLARPLRLAVRCSTSSILTAEVAPALAPHLGVDAPTSETAGLLRNLGLLSMADTLPRETSDALTEAAKDANCLVDEEMERRCGIG